MLQRTLPTGFIAPTKTDKLPADELWLHEKQEHGQRPNHRTRTLHLSVDPPTPGGPVPVLPPQLEKALELLTDASDRAAMDVAVHVLGGKPYTLELDNRETLHRCQWLAIDLGAKVRISEDKKNPRHWFLEISPSDEE
jgi:hypothetical protein